MEVTIEQGKASHIATMTQGLQRVKQFITNKIFHAILKSVKNGKDTHWRISPDGATILNLGSNLALIKIEIA